MERIKHKEMSKLTYIWGAGASAGTMNEQHERTTGVPVVSQLKESLQNLLERLDTPFRDEVLNGIEESKYKELINALRKLLSMMKESDTIDHYAKRLLMENKTDETCCVDYNNPYKFCKRILSIFLLMIQDKDNYDKRYDTFIEEIYNITKEPPCLTILSWNYDAQFELAYAKYAKSKYILDLWDEINVYNKTCGTKYDKTKPFSLVKLNGTAFFRDHLREDTNYKSMYKVPDVFYGGYSQPEKIELYYKLLTEYYQETTLSYAWDEIDSTFLDSIKERVSDTIVLIIIGYSCPSFNKEIDKNILDSMPFLQKIIIQDKNELICKRVESHIRSLIESSNIIFEYETNTSRFYVPYEYDGYTEEQIKLV